MNSAITISKARTREWPSYHGSAVPLQTDPFLVGEEFVRALHHRLCQPLTALSCALEVMQMGRESDPRLTGQIHAAIMQSEKIGEMMGMFRQMFEAGTRSTGSHAVRLGQVLTEVAEDLAPLARSQAVSVNIIDASGNELIDMAQSSLRQVLWGVVQNCIEVSLPGAQIVITCDEGEIVICDGSGCSNAESDDAFDPFSFTANKSAASRVSNLPVALAQALVVAAGGEMHVTSAMQGRRFRLAFPLPLSVAG
jgi:signal transduction histidine kinase